TDSVQTNKSIEQAVSPAAVGPITASLTDNVPATNPTPKPGQTITYTATITNTGSTDATGAAFSDTPDANTTLVNGSVHASPVTGNDSYTTVANTVLEVGVTPSGAPAVGLSGSVYDNDSQPNNTGGT